MKIAVIGRTEILYDTIEKLLENNHDIRLIITSEEAPEYTKTSKDFEELANKIGAKYIYTNKLDDHKEEIREANCDIAVSLNYSSIISQDVIDLFSLGVLNASGELEIGDNTSIGLNVMVWTHDSHKLNIRGKNTKEHNSGIIRKKTKIGSNCFIAGPSVIMPGVTIGDKCIIAPMSVVYEDLPSKTIYQPYKKIIEQQKIIDTNTKKIELLEHQLNEFKELLKLFWENKNEQDNERINNLWGGVLKSKKS